MPKKNKRHTKTIVGLVTCALIIGWGWGCNGTTDIQQKNATTTVVNWTDAFPSVGSSDTVRIDDGRTIIFDPAGTTRIKKLIITRGTFLCANDRVARTLETGGILVKGPNAHFNCPLGQVNSKLAIKFIGKLTFSATQMTCATGHQHQHDSGQQAFLVVCGAKLTLKGFDRGRSWTLTADNQNILAGSRTIVMSSAADIANWQRDDKIVVAPSSPNPEDIRTYTIDSISGNTITIQESISKGIRSKNMAYGYGQYLDQRVEVANLTRNIQISGTIDRGKSYHLMFMQPGQIKIESTEFIGGGHMGEMGRYPIHWHIAGDRLGDSVKKSSIHDTQQRCITIHGTNWIRLEDNVCFNHVGHGFFLEDGDEQNNYIFNNLAMKGRSPTAGKALLRSDVETNSSRFRQVAGFWISNPNNRLRDNAAVAEGTGFWYALKNMTGLSGNGQGQRLANFRPSPIRTPLALFLRNRAHANGVGLSIDGGPNEVCSEGTCDENGLPTSGNPNDSCQPNTCDDAAGSMIATGTNYNPTSPSYIENFVAFKNRDFGLWVRAEGGNTIIRNTISGDNYVNYGLVFDQLLKDSVVVGKSANMNRADLKYIQDTKAYAPSVAPTDVTQLMPASGLVLYDGPIHLQNVEFADYRADVPIEYKDKFSFNAAPIPFVLTSAANVRSTVHLSEGLSFVRSPNIRGDFAYTFGHNAKGNWSVGLHDLDGSLTGTANVTIKPDMLMNQYPGCQTHTKFRNAQVCPGTFGLVWIEKSLLKMDLLRHTLSTDTLDPFKLNQQPNYTSNSVINQFSFPHVNSTDYRYIIKPDTSEPFNAKVYVKYGVQGEWSPWLDFRYTGHRCELNNIATSNHEIRTHEDNRLVFRVKYTERGNRTREPFAYEASFKVTCNTAD